MKYDLFYNRFLILEKYWNDVFSHTFLSQLTQLLIISKRIKQGVSLMSFFNCHPEDGAKSGSRIMIF